MYGSYVVICLNERKFHLSLPLIVLFYLEIVDIRTIVMIASTGWGAELRLRTVTQGENTCQDQASIAPLQKPDTSPHRTELLLRQSQQIREGRKEIGAH